MRRAFQVTAIACWLLVTSSPGARAASFEVDSEVDDIDASPGDALCATAGGLCTLRAAIQESNALAGADTIEVPAGGGLMNGGTAHIVNSTISRNRANNRPYNGGGGVDNRASQTALVTFKNSITMGNSRYDCAGVPSFEPDPLPGLMVSLGHNIRGGTCPVLLDGTDLSSVDPMLMPGPRSFPRTLALAPGSPAIDAGDDAACPATDARGVPRPQDGDGDSVATCDIGAYEVEP